MSCGSRTGSNTGCAAIVLEPIASISRPPETDLARISANILVDGLGSIARVMYVDNFVVFRRFTGRQLEALTSIVFFTFADHFPERPIISTLVAQALVDLLDLTLLRTRNAASGKSHIVVIEVDLRFCQGFCTMSGGRVIL